MFDGRFRTQAEASLKPIGASIGRSGLKADHLTIAGLCFAIAAGVAIANGALRGGLLLVGLAGITDVLDGAVAKATGTASPRGAFFDSVVDRVADGCLFFGTSWYLTSSSDYGAHWGLLPMALLGGAMLISYERAKAESLGFDARGGLMERAERFVFLGFGLLFDPILVPVLLVMLVLVAITAVQRFAKVWKQADAPVAVIPEPVVRPSARSNRVGSASARRNRRTPRRGSGAAWRARIKTRETPR